DVGHHEIRDDEIEVLLREGLHGLAGCQANSHLHPAPREKAIEKAMEHLLIVDDENLRLLAHRANTTYTRGGTVGRLGYGANSVQPRSCGGFEHPPEWIG